VAAGKKKALAASNANTTSDSALERPSGVGGEARTSRDSPQLNVSKRKAEELSSSDCHSRSFNRPPAHGLGDRPAAHGTMDKLAAQSSWQLGPTEGGLEFDAVVTGRAGLQQASGPQDSPANGSDHTEPAASSEVAIGRMSLADMSGPLCGMPDTSSSPHVAINSVAPAGE